MKPPVQMCLAAALLAVSSATAWAHPDHGTLAGQGALESVAAGFIHPLSGADHAMAMVAVGLWAVLIGGRAVWLMPSAFVLAMTAGFAAAVAGVELPWVEPAIAASVVVFGLLVAIALPVPPALVAGLVAAFAIVHGHAHGAEIGTAGVWPYAAGFALATAILHGAGIVTGLLASRYLGQGAGVAAVRIAGAGVALGGLTLAMAG